MANPKLLFEKMFGSKTNKGRETPQMGFERGTELFLEGRTKTSVKERLHLHLISESPEKNKIWLCFRTQTIDGKEDWEILGKFGTGSSQEWDKERQSNRKSRDSNAQQSSRGGHLPELPNRIQSPLICPFCFSNELTLKQGWRAGVVLDPFVGSGTTLQVAQELGLNGIGVELNPKYIPLIEARLNREKFQQSLNPEKIEIITG